MRINRSTSLLLSAAVAVAVAAPAAAGPDRDKGEHPNDFTNQDHDVAHVCNTDGDMIVIEGSDILWPPNHREVDYLVSAVDGGVEDQTTSIGTVSSHDEVGMNGAGDPSNVDAYDGDAGTKYTDDDGNRRVDTTVTLLAERSGQGDGREYTIDVTANFDEPQPCTYTYTVHVPHDMGVKPQDERGRQTDDDA